MLISSRGRYGLRIMIELAELRETNEYVPLRNLAEQQDISEKYLEAILKHLVTEGLIEGRRGKGGGYRLTKPADEISVHTILVATEQNLSPVSCLDQIEGCNRREECKTFPLWEALDNNISQFLKSVSLQDLLQDSKALTSPFEASTKN